jgi:Tfp pilus assembly PilM family ATPase
MIKNIFIPEKIGDRYLFSKRIIGFDIGKTHINATQLYLNGTHVTLEKFIEIPLELGTVTNYPERVGNAIKLVMLQVDRYDEIRTSLSSSLVVFKEIKLPFVGHDKIALVIDFEIEPLLPFAINDALVDFIITKELDEEKSSLPPCKKFM